MTSMTTIIKEGYISKITYQNTCPRCGCIYTYEESDTTYDLTGQRILYCPCCHEINHVSSPPGYVFNPYKITCNYESKNCSCQYCERDCNDEQK